MPRWVAMPPDARISPGAGCSPSGNPGATLRVDEGMRPFSGTGGLTRLILLLSLASIPLGPGDLSGQAGGREAMLPDHTPFTRVLQQVVRGPLVDYAGLVEFRGDLDRYIASLGATAPATLEASPRDAQLAFWINAYNACMLKLVTDHYPIQRGGAGLFGSIRNLVAGYPANSVWQIREVFSRHHCRVAGAQRSQDEIEHEIIRPRFNEPRIHFAVNCAAQSCPVLWPEAYEADRLDAQLDRAVRQLMSGSAHFRIDRGSTPTLHLNRVLDWYQEDFGGVDGVRTFFADYVTGPDRDLLLDNRTQVAFFEYDWTLNDLPR